LTDTFHTQPLLIEKGLIEYLDGERTFKTTEKGMKFLRIHDRVEKLNPVAPALHSNVKRIDFLKRLSF